MKNYVKNNDIPLGLGMALSKNLEALNQFATLSKEQQQVIINQTHLIHSKNEMQAFVQQIAERKYV
ncbi:hypothetical protein RBG61_09465 [Paludicola sp. MB14-C6]|uniref:hypothetical protein n=1 Tax=Paludihabitans sp. MB14-C6 TaxID=3070656 RepID=UPI0027DAF8E5|nr:hypothetical protein [Paludicola sp. MB14-C6]WMJ22215.1 hypothetical protein RBG61_09465 [Paludicola sp. MB14-C6]